MQILVAEPEYRRYARTARARGMTVSEWVRQSLREAVREEPVVDRGRKLAAIRVAASCAFPTADIDTMLSEIDRGRDLGLDA